MFTEQDTHWMQHAIDLAKTAAKNNEVPVGAVLVLENKIIGEGWNRPIKENDPSAHAECIALREAGKTVKNYRLVNSKLYVTLEPCVMCLGALVHARVSEVVFGADDPKSGAVKSAFSLGNSEKFNHRIEFRSGLMAKESREILQNFFRERR